MDWQPIETAPRDGRKVWVKRVHEGDVVSEGWAVYAQLAVGAPGRQPLGPDPLNRLSPADYAREAAETQAWADSLKWLREDRMYAFPTPTHWSPSRTARPDNALPIQNVPILDRVPDN